MSVHTLFCRRSVLWMAVFMVAILLACEPAARNPSGNMGDAYTESPDQGADAGLTDTQQQGTYPDSATLSQRMALQELNRVRALVGLPIVNEVAALNKAALAHAKFITRHCRQYANMGVSPHQEDSSFGDGFTGQWPWDRTAAAGYPQTMGVGEVIAFVAAPTEAVDQWVDSLYHRLLIFDLGLKEIGYGKSKDTNCTNLYGHVDVMDLGIGMPSPSAPAVVLYPPDGATDVPRAFNGYESPQPPVPKGGYPSGTMITAQLRDVRVQWTGHKLIEVDTKRDVPHMAVSNVPNPEAGVDKDPQAMSGMKPYIAIYAHSPLNPNTKYRVEIKMNLEGENLMVASEFTTGL